MSPAPNTPIPIGVRGIGERLLVPRSGKIALGIVKKTRAGVEYPSATDYFVIKPAADDENLLAEMVELLGVNPKRIPIMFLGEPEDFARYNFKSYAAGTGLRCVGNGLLASGRVDPKQLDEWATTEFEGPPPRKLWPSQKRGAPTVETEWHEFPCFGTGYDGLDACPMVEAVATRLTGSPPSSMARRGKTVWRRAAGSA